MWLNIILIGIGLFMFIGFITMEKWADEDEFSLEDEDMMR